MLKQFLRHLSIFIFFFLLLNLLLSFLWAIAGKPLYSKLIRKNYTSNQIEKIGLKENEIYNFYKETWVNKSYQYKPFAEHVEKNTKKQKYVNVNEFGRLMANPNKCDVKFNFYGSSIVFGYNVKDNQTIPYYFQKVLNNNKIINACVYNYGNAYYFSTQENIFFISHLLEKKINRNDFAIFLDHIDEPVNPKTGMSNKISKAISEVNNDYQVFISLKKLFTDLFLVKYFLIMHKKYMSKIKSENKATEEDIKKTSSNQSLLNKNFKIRQAICKEFQINCLTFLHPINFIDIEKSKKNSDNFLLSSNKEFKNFKNVMNLSKLFIDEPNQYFLDKGHFSPYGNKLIAKEIFEPIKRIYKKKNY